MKLSTREDKHQFSPGTDNSPEPTASLLLRPAYDRIFNWGEESKALSWGANLRGAKCSVTEIFKHIAMQNF